MRTVPWAPLLTLLHIRVATRREQAAAAQPSQAAPQPAAAAGAPATTSSAPMDVDGGATAATSSGGEAALATGAAGPAGTAAVAAAAAAAAPLPAAAPSGPALVPFALVDEVSEGSPAASAGLQVRACRVGCAAHKRSTRPEPPPAAEAHPASRRPMPHRASSPHHRILDQLVVDLLVPSRKRVRCGPNLHTNRNPDPQPPNPTSTPTSTPTSNPNLHTNLRQVGDLLCSFGDVSGAGAREASPGAPPSEQQQQQPQQQQQQVLQLASTAALLQRVAGVLGASEGQAVAATVLRQGAPVVVSLTPQRWSGRGLLGCHLKPL